MTATWSSPASALAKDLQLVFGLRLQSVVAYGPHLDGDTTAPLTCLALVSTLTVADLEACARVAAKWVRTGLATPLILPVSEFRRSLDSFPLEYGEIIRRHERVLGDDPFAGLTIERGDLRRACETQIVSHLVHLREGFIEAGGRPSQIAELVAASAPAFTAFLRNLARLAGVTTQDRVDITRQGARAAGVPDGLVSELLTLEHRSTIPTSDPAKLFPEYLTEVERLALRLDTWPA
jgi:hypothetical protein